MTRIPAIRRFGPIALGSVVAIAALTQCAEEEPPLRSFEEDLRSGRPIATRLDSRPGSDARLIAPMKTARPPAARLPAARTLRALAQASTSELTLAQAIADGQRPLELAAPLIPAEFMPPPPPLSLGELAATREESAPHPLLAGLLPEPAAEPSEPTVSGQQMALAEPAPPSPDMAPAPQTDVREDVLTAFAPVIEPITTAAQPILAAEPASPAIAAAPPASLPQPVVQRASQPAIAAPRSAPAISSATGTQPPTAALASVAGRPTSLASGRQTFPLADDAPLFTYDDELILQIRVQGVAASDTIIAYGTRDGVFLPLGELARILDLAIRVSDDGNFANGWFLSEDRTLTIDLRQQTLTSGGITSPLEAGTAQAFDGELFLRSEMFAALLPLAVEPDLRAQSVLLTTREPFPFEERMARDAERAQLAARLARPEGERWPRAETPWLAASVPMADAELRAVSDNVRGERIEGELRLAGDLAFMTGQAYLNASSDEGLVAALVELGRRDADGDLLGPLRATEFQLGDTSTVAMPMGLRGVSGRGGFVTNQAFESASVFEKIDLRGILATGYEVELYRNDILLGSTAEAVNGQYEFLDVPVDYGLNIFRLVFYGPQGQRREEVRRISVGDGRLPTGKLEYNFGTVQRAVNLLGVEGPDFRPGIGYGEWRSVGTLAYGINRAITATASAALVRDNGTESWLATAGLRTGIGSLALRGDVGVSSGDGRAAGLGIGGRALGGSFTASHFEYRGDFVDEVRGGISEPLRRSTELDFNTSLVLGGADTGQRVPIALRARRQEFVDGRSQTSASVRGSARFGSLSVSNTFDYSRSSARGGQSFSQLIGNFDLATFGRSRTQLRASVAYNLHPDPEIAQVSGEVVHRLDDETYVSASSSYALATKDVSLGLSASRAFERFTLALDGQVAPRNDSYSVALRFAFSLGRDPLRQRFFMDRPGQGSLGAVAVRAFQDMDGDSLFGPGDTPLPEVQFSVSNGTAATDENGLARLTGLGHGNRVSVQTDPSSLPDILMAPVTRGIEIIPRPGRFHTADFPIVALSEVEGTVSFSNDSSQRGVSGLQLQLRRADGEVQNVVRTERGGYFFFEQVMPGDYTLVIEPGQAARLGLCLADQGVIAVGHVSDIITANLQVATCEQ